MFYRLNNEQGFMLPILFILLLFLSSYVLTLFQSYETNMLLYEELEQQTISEIQQMYTKKQD